MPLRFEPPADPLTVAASGVTPSAASHVIESDALQRLTKEIERYGRRELAGRSILIAGHRGVGKTTLVRKAIESARVSITKCRPLFVDLHGPDLLAPPDKETAGKRASGKHGETNKNGAAKTAKSTGEGEQNPAASAGDTKEDAEQDPKKAGADGSAVERDSAPLQPSGADLQSFVERLTFSLYRAATKEFVDSFRARRDHPGPADGSTYGEYSELAEQFALELDGSTDLGRIRLLYERVGAFEKGVLGTSRLTTGSQELALLASSSQAYRIISGKLDENRKQSTSGTNTVNWAIAADNLLSPITGLLAGSLAWAALPGDFGPLAKLFTSFTTGLASAIAVKFTRTILRESKQSSEVSFVPERDKLALRRLLPVLVDRFCDVGLPPIFVVDELDKVPNISERMESLMGFLKQFVTERAFFCFLVDRNYYERIENTVSTFAFPKEATLFGDRLFVQYKPESAHVYLKNVTKVDTLTAGESQDDAARDLEVLPYVLLRRSCMHPFDLRREISRCTNAKNEFRFPPRALFNVQQYRNEVYYQVAVECVLAAERMLDFAEDPNRAQLLYDALYFPIRTKKPPAEFDASRDILKAHLIDRMCEENSKLLSEEDVSLLHFALSELVRFLCDPRALLDTLQSAAAGPRAFPPAAVGVIEAAAGPKPVAAATSPSGGAGPNPADGSAGAGPLGPPNDLTPAPAPPGAPPPPPDVPGKAAPLLAAADGNKYRWQFNKYGYPQYGYTPTSLIKVVELQAVSEGTTVVTAEATTLLTDFDDAAKFLTERHGTAFDIELWERMRLIPTPPTWSYLSEAADALRNPVSQPAAKMEEYKKALMEYRSKLQSALNGIWFAVAIAAKMTVQARKSTSAPHERDWIEVLEKVLAEAPSRDQMLKQLLGIATDAVSGVPSPADSVGTNASYRIMLEAIEEAAKTVRERPAIAASEVAQQSGTFYENWFVQFYLGRHPQIDYLWPFLSLAMGSLQLGLQKISPLQMTIADWAAANMEQQSPRPRAVSLERLGFRRSAEELAVEHTEDPVLAAMLQSIRKRGYEKASVILQPLPDTLTQSWLPSENVACRIRMPETELPDMKARYILVEVDDREMPDQIKQDLTNFRSAARLALFGGAVAKLPSLLRSYPYINSPQSLDDLVERLDAMPASDWADPKSAPR
jgi:hypothetical protein